MVVMRCRIPSQGQNEQDRASILIGSGQVADLSAKMTAVTADDRSGRARVLVVGDANPDLVLRGDVVPRFGQAEQLLDSADLVIGGSAGITAHAFARLDRPVSLLAAVGPDTFGRELAAKLADAGVDVSTLAHRADVPTGFTVVLSHGADRAILTLPGAIPTLTAAEVRGAVATTAEHVIGHVHVS